MVAGVGVFEGRRTKAVADIESTKAGRRAAGGAMLWAHDELPYHTMIGHIAVGS